MRSTAKDVEASLQVLAFAAGWERGHSPQQCLQSAYGGHDGANYAWSETQIRRYRNVLIGCELFLRPETCFVGRLACSWVIEGHNEENHLACGHGGNVGRTDDSERDADNL